MLHGLIVFDSFSTPVFMCLISLLDMHRRALGRDCFRLNFRFLSLNFSQLFQSISSSLQFYSLGYWESNTVLKFNRSNVGEFFWNSKKTVEKRKRKLLSCVYVLCVACVHKTPWNEALSRRSPEVTAKKCTKKAWCTCKVIVLLI